MFVKDGMELGKYDDTSVFIYSPDSKSYAYKAEKDGKFFILKDGVELG